MSEQELDAAGKGRSGTSGWRSIAVGVGLFALGLVAGATLFGDVGETPCYEVEERAQPIQDEISATFGAGEEGRQAMRDLLELAHENPSCFDPAEVEFLEDQLQSSPGEHQTVEPTVVPTASAVPSS